MLPQGILASCTRLPIIDGATLPIFDVFIIGIPTSCGDFPDRKAFRDSNGPTPMALLLAPRGLAHHGIIFVPLRCASTLDQLTVVRIVYLPLFLPNRFRVLAPRSSLLAPDTSLYGNDRRRVCSPLRP
ncbi:hypothetical protein B0H14DRAFT_3556677 [Mycena olivaceomarginata]|nr:hypothetical protein B0H14DRAFT_3556677 [Mycena olivaceomarginata]